MEDIFENPVLSAGAWMAGEAFNYFFYNFN